MESIGYRTEATSVAGVAVAGFVVFLLVNYLALFGVVTLDETWVHIALGIIVGYAGARLTA